MTYVYGLVCVASGDIRYVGCSVDPRQRLLQHANGSGAPLVGEWIRRARRRPDVRILHRCKTRGEALRREKMEIRRRIRDGALLLNEFNRPDRPQVSLLHRQHGAFMTTAFGCKVCEAARIRPVLAAVAISQKRHRARLDTTRKSR